MTNRQSEKPDVSEDKPFDAMARLGLALVREPI